MDSSSLTPADAHPSTELAEVVVEFPDNRLLIDLCGEIDRNLSDIEDRLSVQILRRGNQLAVIGDAEAQQAAIDLLQTLYARLEQGRSLSLIHI